MKIYNSLFIMLAMLVAMTSCSSSKHTSLPYFADIEARAEGEFAKQSYHAKIAPDNELFISITSKDPLATAAYNMPMLNTATRDDLLKNTTPRAYTYLVDSEGNITMPVLGTIHVAGLTTEQLRDKLIKLVSAEVKDPIVTVDMTNFSVIVSGEVKTPAIIPVATERMTILEALASAGDLTEYGERSNVLIIRENVDGTRQFGHVDLNSSEVLTSPYYYLQPKDYIYVSPNKIKQDNSKYNQNNAFKLSVISTIVSGCSVVASLIIALTR